MELDSRILYCDVSCVVVNKTAGEAMEGAGKGMVDLPKQLATRQLASLPAADILELPAAVHRLDVPVSGCALFARTKTALAFLNESFKKDLVEKKYWAIAEMPKNNLTQISEETNEFVHWIYFDKQKNKSIAFDDPGTETKQQRKKAILRCRIIGKGINYLFLEIDLVTGRHHQIRAQLERLGLHVKGDLKYGAKRSDRATQSGGGIRLHAHSLVFPNPSVSNENIIVTAAPLLRDNLWLAFEKYI